MNGLEDELNAQAVTEENTPVLFLVTFRAAATKLGVADEFNLRGKLDIFGFTVTQNLVSSIS